MSPSLFLAALTWGAPALADPPAETQVWVGHQVAIGARHIPVLGNLETRAESYLLARMHMEGDVLVLEQKSCAFAFKEVLGVRVSLSPETIAHLPGTTIRYTPAADGKLVAAPWVVGWGEEDIDEDGSPGATIRVDSTLCDGELHVRTRASTTAVGELVDGGLAGTVKVETTESVLGASKWCLRLGSSERKEVQSGTVRYQRVAPTTTCESLSVAKWPVQAAAP